MNRFFARTGNLIAVFAAITAACSVGYNIIQQEQINRMRTIAEISKAKEGLLNDSLNEILMNRISELRENVAEVNRNQGKVEGMVAASMNIAPEHNHTSAIWHEGYYRGLGQTAMIEESAYIAGYHRATEDMNCPASVKDKMNSEAPIKYQRDKQIDVENNEFNKALDEAEKRRKNIEKLKNPETETPTQPQPSQNETPKPSTESKPK